MMANNPHDAKKIYKAMIGIQTCKIETFKIYFEKGMHIHATDDDHKSFLWYACHYNRPDIVKWLIERGVSLNNQDDDRKMTPLMLAVLANVDMVRLLLDAGANVHLKDWLGRGAAFLSLSIMNEEMFTLLMEAGADINDLFSPTFLTFRDIKYHLEKSYVLEYFKQHENQLNAENKEIWKKIRLHSVFQ